MDLIIAYLLLCLIFASFLFSSDYYEGGHQI